MTAIGDLQKMGQKLWLDNITRGMLADGSLQRYIDQYGITGLTSNPSIFDQAIRTTNHYDEAISEKARAGKSGEALFFELALEDLTRAADLFRPLHEASRGVDGWVSLEVSPLLARDTAQTVHAAADLHERAQRSNLFIKIPGTAEGKEAIAEAIMIGIPVNVTLLFSCEHYRMAADAYMDGLERRLKAGLSLDVASVASLFISRWDRAVAARLPPEWRNILGVAIGMRTYQAYVELLHSPRWKALAAAGAKPQRLLWASTGTKDPAAPDTLYVDSLAAPDTINTAPDKTVLAFADHGRLGAPLPADGKQAEQLLGELNRRGIDDAALAEQLQREGADAFVAAWQQLLACIAEKSVSVKQAM